MKNATAFKGQKALAMAIVAMFAICAFAVCIPSDSDAGVYGGVSDNTGDKINQVYAVNMAIGQKFTYDNIKTNLDSADGTVEITGAPAGTGNTATATPTFTDGSNSGKKFEITFSTTGAYVYTITAKWTHNTDKNLTQTATQKFVFDVVEKIELPTDVTGYGIKGKAQEAIEISYGGPSNVNITIGTYAGTGDEKLTDGSELFTAAITDGKLVITPKDDVKNNVATYGFKVTLKNPDNPDTASVNVKYQVFETVTIVAPAADYTYEGDKNAPTEIKFSTNWDKVTGAQSISYELTATKDTNALKDVITIANANSTVATVEGVSDAGIETIVKGDATKAVYTVTLKATGTIAGSDVQNPEPKTSTASTTLTVYKALAFATAPTVSSVSTNVLTSAGTGISLSSYIGGAYKVVYDWGDGTQTSSMDNGSKVGTTYSAYHAYAKAGTYTITIYATNDQGTTTAQVFHSSRGVEMAEEQTPGTTEPSADDEEKSFFDEHGFQFLVFAILAILCAIAFFYFGIQSPYVIIIMIVFAALAILCFVYSDIGGIIDAVKDIKL